MKMKIQHIVPLRYQALEILHELRLQTGNGQSLGTLERRIAESQD
jgi:hypothetical protein